MPCCVSLLAPLFITYSFKIHDCVTNPCVQPFFSKKGTGFHLLGPRVIEYSLRHPVLYYFKIIDATAYQACSLKPIPVSSWIN